MRGNAIVLSILGCHLSLACSSASTVGSDAPQASNASTLFLAPDMVAAELKLIETEPRAF